MTCLCFFDAGARSFYFSKKEVTKPADMAGLTIRVQEAAPMIAMVKSLGANATAIDTAEIYQSLQTGVVEGAENNIPFYHSQSHYEVAKYFVTSEHQRIPDIIVMSVITMKKLKPETVAIIKKAGFDASVSQRNQWLNAEKEAETEAEKSGVKITRLTAEQREPFRAATESVRQKYGAQYADLLARIENS